MSYRTTRQTDRDLIAIYVHGVREFGISQAEQYHAGLMRTFELLSANPLMARERTEFVPPVRIHPYEAHLVIYKLGGEDILIIRVLHGRQQWECLL